MQWFWQAINPGEDSPDFALHVRKGSRAMRENIVETLLSVRTLPNLGFNDISMVCTPTSHSSCSQ